MKQIEPKQGISYEELQMYITILLTHRVISYTTPYARISREILKNFAAIVDKKTIQAYFEPSVEEEELDRRLAYGNLGYE